MAIGSTYSSWPLANVYVNPFVYRSRRLVNQADWLKLLLGGIVLLPIRVIILAAFFVIVTPYGWLAYHTIRILTSLFNWSRPTVRLWRYYLRIPMLYCLRVMLYVVGFYELRTTSRCAYLGGAQILALAPHSSIWDVVSYWCLFRVYGNVAITSRYENSRYPLIGSLLMMCDPILVKREDIESRARSREQIRERAKYQKVIIFPEGTCTNGKHIVEFKTGAFVPGINVRPIAIRYERCTRAWDNVTWTWMGTRAIPLILLTLCTWKTTFELTILSSHIPNAEERDNARLYAHRVRQKLCQELQLSPSRYSFDDAKLMSIADEIGLPKSLACLRFLRLCYKIHVDLCMRVDATLHRGLLNETLMMTDGRTDDDDIGETEFTSYRFARFSLREAIIHVINDFQTHLDSMDEDVLVQEINDRKAFVTALNLDPSYAHDVEQSTTVDYLMRALRCESISVISRLTLLILMMLCDIREVSLARRVSTCLRLLSRAGPLLEVASSKRPHQEPHSHDCSLHPTAASRTLRATTSTTPPSHLPHLHESSSSLVREFEDDHHDGITFEQLQLLVWLLLGIESLDHSCVGNKTRFTSTYVAQNLSLWFTRAMFENCPQLLVPWKPQSMLRY